MKKMKLLFKILKITHATEVLTSFLVTIAVVSGILVLVEPSFNSYGDGLWYCYAVITTIGFGDLVATTLVGKVASVVLSINAIFVIAIITSVVVNYYTEVIRTQRKNQENGLFNKMERLEELSKEELKEISDKVKKYRENR